MRVIITGGTGLLGRGLAAELLAGGDEVIVLSREPRRYHELPPGGRIERWDARTADGWAPLAEWADAIVNLAGESLASGRWTDERKAHFRESRVNSGGAVVQAVEVATRRPRVVIQASAVGYYGPRGDEEVTEVTPPGEDFLARLCVEWEASTAPLEALGVRRVVLRTGLVLTTRGGALPRLLLPFRLLVGGPMGSGKQWYPWIHLVDHVAAVCFLLANEAAKGPFNLAAPQPVTNAEFSRTLGRVLGRPAAFPTPAVALRLMLGEMATVVLDGQRAVPRGLEELGFAFRFPDLEPALRDAVR